jgi:hypothetical protein
VSTFEKCAGRDRQSIGKKHGPRGYWLGCDPGKET